MREFPKLGNYPNDVPKEQLVEYVEKLVDWCAEAELKLKYYEKDA